MTHWLTHSCTYNVTHACTTQARLSWRTAVQLNPALVWFFLFSVWVCDSFETCRTWPAGIPILNACKMCKRHVVKQPCFSSLVSPKISGLLSDWTWEHRLCFRHLTLPRHAATAFTSCSQRSQGQRPCRGSGTAGPACSLYQQPPDVWSGLF